MACGAGAVSGAFVLPRKEGGSPDGGYGVAGGLLDEGGLNLKNTDRLRKLGGLKLDGSIRGSVEALDEFLAGFVNQGNASSPLYSSARLLPRASHPCSFAFWRRLELYLLADSQYL
jgi:hypothetical protein